MAESHYQWQWANIWGNPVQSWEHCQVLTPLSPTSIWEPSLYVPSLLSHARHGGFPQLSAWVWRLMHCWNHSPCVCMHVLPSYVGTVLPPHVFQQLEHLCHVQRDHTRYLKIQCVHEYVLTLVRQYVHSLDSCNFYFINNVNVNSMLVLQKYCCVFNIGTHDRPSCLVLF